ncbi:ABC transporter permease [Corynebacterium sp. NPDC060344]|uniref:ABC transporter permease n=1 Tax=Corynebacterium sp. NPDC060344 TaxID=3347101 RepID=UPI00364C1CFE
MNWNILTGYAGKELWRTLRMWDATFFIAVLPAALFLMFGARGDAVEQAAGAGNVSAFVMTSMSVYGAAMATTTLAGLTAVERDAGWGRQLALTSLSTTGYYAAKVLVSLIIALLPIAVIHVIGAIVGASLDEAWMWAASMALSLVVALPFALYGLAVAMLFRSEAAVSAASGMLVVFSFFGTLFMPLDGIMLDIAKFTPMYGPATLARWPQLEGLIAPATAGAMPGQESLGLALANIAAWTLIFLVVCVIAGRNRNRR